MIDALTVKLQKFQLNISHILTFHTPIFLDLILLIFYFYQPKFSQSEIITAVYILKCNKKIPRKVLSLKNKYLNHNYNVIKVKTSAPNNFVIVPQKISNTNLKRNF